MKKFIPTVENYLNYRGKKVNCGNSIVLVTFHRTESRGGSWERGFKFYETEWGMLQQCSDKLYSMDHGKTWHSHSKIAAKKSKGKTKLKSHSHGEFAFDGIQKLNRDYYGPGYKWSR